MRGPVSESNEPGISAVLVIRNEGRLLSRCLSSLAGAVQEIIVLHDGECQDDSLTIAASFGAKTIVGEYRGAMEFHFPRILEIAENDWILRIDADEFLSPGLKAALPGLVRDQGPAAYSFYWPLFDGIRTLSSSWPRKTALFLKSRLSFLGVPHFSLRLSGPIKKTGLVLGHQPEYDNLSAATFRSKQSAWAKLQAETYLEPFSKIAKFGWPGTSWPAFIRWRIKYPLLLLPAEFLVTFSRNILSGAYRAGWLGLKAGYRAASYRAMVNYYIFQAKKKCFRS